MIQLSSKISYYKRRLVPAVFFGLLTMFTLAILATAIGQREPVMLAILPFPAILAGFGYLILRWLLFSLADEVWDDGDALLVRRGRQEVRVPLADIIDVKYAGYHNPPRVTLYLRQPTVLGNKIKFVTPMQLNSLSMPAPIRELTQRADEARNHQDVST